MTEKVFSRQKTSKSLISSFKFRRFKKLMELCHHTHHNKNRMMDLTMRAINTYYDTVAHVAPLQNKILLDTKVRF